MTFAGVIRLLTSVGSYISSGFKLGTKHLLEMGTGEGIQNLTKCKNK